MRQVATLVQNRLLTAFSMTPLRVFVASIYFVLLAQISIPLIPVPLTLQTLAVYSLGLLLGKKEAAYATLLYLFYGTIGFPVFAGFAVKPLWMFSPTAGYLIAFPLAAFVTGWVAEKTFFMGPVRYALAVLLGQGVIYSSGVSVLAAFVGPNQALVYGFYPFIFLGVLKLGMAVSMKMGWNAIRFMIK